MGEERESVGGLRDARTWAFLAAILVVAILDLALPTTSLSTFMVVPIVASSALGRPRLTAWLAVVSFTAVFVLERVLDVTTVDMVRRLVLILVTDLVAVALARLIARWNREILEERHRYRLLAENASDVVYLVGSDRRATWVSPSITVVLGWTPEEIVGSDLLDKVHPEDQPALAGDRERFYGGAGSGDSSPVARFLTKSGEYHWMSVRASPVATPASNDAVAVVGLRLVDDLIESRREARQAGDQVHAIMDSLIDPHGVLEPVHDPSGAVIDFCFSDANDAASSFYGRPKSELVGQQFLPLMPGDVPPWLFPQFLLTLETGRPMATEVEVVHRDTGESRIIDVRLVRVGALLSCTWRDVTAARREALALAESEERYRLLAENASDVVMLLDDEGRILWVSPALHETMGWRPADFIGRSGFDFTHPADLLRFSDDWQAMSGGEAARSHGGWVTRVRMRARDGSFHWIELQARLYATLEGQPDGVVAAFRVVDAEVAAAQELERRATYDDLTTALKRDAGLDRLQSSMARARAPGYTCAVLFLDIDDFKEVNDTWGHLAGDAVLTSVVDRIAEVAGARGEVARMGGDELLVILEDMHGIAEAQAVADRVRLAVSAPIATDAGQVAVTASIGVTVPVPGESVDAVLARADEAMYAAKRGGRDRVAVVPGA